MNRSFLIILALSITLLAACAPAATTRPDLLRQVNRSASEAIGTDVLAGTLPSSKLTIAGVQLSMTQTQVQALLGKADKEDSYDFGGIQNWAYGKSLGLSSNGIIVHFENGFVTRITVLEPLTEHLVGTTQLGMTKEKVYATFGIPDRQYDIKNGRYFVYDARGLEVYLLRDVVNGYGFVISNRKLPSTATIEGMNNNPLTPKTPRLIIDTTTVCDQGPTQAFNPGSGACMAYATYCDIPSNWIEVKSCNPEDVNNEALITALRSQQ